MKKKISILLIICLILPFILTLITFAAGDAVEFSVVGNRNAQRGETFTISVNMDCTTSFAAGNFVLTYNNNVLE